MNLIRRKIFVGIFFLSLGMLNGPIFAQVAQKDSIKSSIDNIDYYLQKYNEWYPQNYDLAVKMRSLVHYMKDQRVDSILQSLKDYQASDSRYFFRTIENMSDSLQAPGYVGYQKRQEELLKIDRAVRNSLNKNDIKVPRALIEQAQLNVGLLTPSETYKLLESNYVVLPDSLQNLDVKMNQNKLTTKEIEKLQQMDSIRTSILETARQKYNTEKLKHVEDSVSALYCEQVVENYSQGEQQKYIQKLDKQNRLALEDYNEKSIAYANRTVSESLNTLISYVDREQVSIWIHNSMEDSTEIRMSNAEAYTSRFFIKNEQRDSLGVRAFAVDRNSFMLFIDDGVTLNRFKERKHKEADFAQVNLNDKLSNFSDRYEVVTPWKYGVAFNAGLNQTYLKNWVKGGETSLAGLLTFKGYANYNLDRITWSNSIDMRNGWISTNEDGLEKNEDKFELISNFGLQAVKKWYYSMEVDLETQLFNSYNYPDRDNPKSGFLAPLRTLFKLGMDYKDGDLSVFVSPLTMKSVSVRDTSIYDQTKYGIDENEKSYWDIGFNIDVKYSQKVMENISFQTKYKMFLDYQSLLTYYDINWENTIDFKINDFLKAQLILHLLYDDNVTFDTGRVDSSGEAIYKAKWQFKEFLSLGFVYKLDRVQNKRRIITK